MKLLLVKMYVLIMFGIFIIADAAPNLVADNIKLETLATSICETEVCKTASRSILEYIDPRVHPCDDFYQFACGNYLDNKFIPEDEYYIFVIGEIEKKLKAQVRELVEEEIKESDSKAEKLMKTFYGSCMNADKTGEESIGEFLEIIEKLGGWPLLRGQKWNSTVYGRDMIYRLYELGYSPDYLMTTKIDTNTQNVSERVITLDQPNLGLPPLYLLQGSDNDVVLEYSKLMVDLVVALGANHADAVIAMNKALEFETRLAGIMQDPAKITDVTLLSKFMTVEELDSKYPGFRWTQYINGFLAPYTSLQPHEKILVYMPRYYRQLAVLLGKNFRSNVLNYVLWRFLNDAVDFLSGNAQLIYEAYIKTVTYADRKPRADECYEKTKENFEVVINSLYAKKYLAPQTRSDAKGVMENIKESFRKSIAETEWMDEETRKKALEKLDWIESYVGYPDELVDDQKIDEYYKDLKIDPRSYFKNSLSVKHFSRKSMIESLRKPMDRKDWTTHSVITRVDASYVGKTNTLDIPAGILQENFFASGRPNYMNYGAIGSVMGHELTHAFDNLRYKFDKEGRANNWWDTATEEKFEGKQKCLINQYDGYQIEKLHTNVNGTLTLTENIADNGGIRHAYNAYKRWEKENKIEKKLPNLNYTPRQLFWISAATVQCSKIRDEVLAAIVAQDSYAPKKFRVIGSFSNMLEFAEDFECSNDSKMNPKDRCIVW